MPSARTDFFSLILLWLWRDPWVWGGGLAAGVGGFVVMAELGLPYGVLAALLPAGAAVGANAYLDRRRLPGRRRLYRGRRLSLRRLAAMVAALALVTVLTGLTVDRLRFALRVTEQEQYRPQRPGEREQRRGTY
ncbi:MAG TPA: hypothetical protein VEA38_14695 [Terriglobales bacterium]|nr:hypothetical protein [Terriglobales bacterium]